MTKSLWRTLGVLMLVVASSAPAFAAAAWTAAQTHGTVFSLVGDKWEELGKGLEFSGEQVIRTLQSGRLQLDGPNGRIELGGGTAIQLNGLHVTQFSGSMTIEAARGSSLTVTANAIVATINGKATLRFDGAEVSIKVTAGSVKVADTSHGQAIDLVAGQSLEASETGIAEASSAGDSARSSNAVGANPNANAAAGSNGNAGGNDNGNAGGGGGNGNSGGGGDGNAGGNGNGNSGGNGDGGNGNSGGNGDGNSGGNGNGNSGGNGNGNGGGNGNGNGNGS